MDVRIINYPNPLMDIVVLGWPGPWQRSWTIRPKKKGKYVLWIHPRGIIDHNSVQLFTLNFPGDNSPPLRVELPFSGTERNFKEWQWGLVDPSKPFQGDELLSTDLSVVEEINFLSQEEQDSASLQSGLEEGWLISRLIFQYQPLAEGSFRLHELESGIAQRYVAWSCNQPYENLDNVTDPYAEGSPEVFDWYQKLVKKFNPAMIWGLGDTAYSDGCGDTNYVDSVYDTPGWQFNPENINALRHSYRMMYRHHWSFEKMQWVQRNYPHLAVWDDHEIRDGWGSEASDFQDGNAEIYKVAHQIAHEYIYSFGPIVRKNSDSGESDAHQLYIDGPNAVFIFDGRTSRQWASSAGRVISEEQMEEFRQFLQLLITRREVKFFLMGCAVPWVNLLDWVEWLGAKAPKAVTDKVHGIRDDVRDSWNAPDNQGQLAELLRHLRHFHKQRPDMEIINISGDIHIANAFSVQPPGFGKPIYQLTTSALSNRTHVEPYVQELIGVGSDAETEVLGVVKRIWGDVIEPNILLIESDGNSMKFSLKIFDLEANKKGLMGDDVTKTLELLLTQSFVSKES